METNVDDVLDTLVPVHLALAPMTVTALSHARMSNARKAQGDHSNYWEDRFITTVDCIAHLLSAAFNHRDDFDLFTARRRQLENFLGDEADDPDVWSHTDRIQRGMVELWRGE